MKERDDLPKKPRRDHETLSDGAEYGLEPLHALDLSKVDGFASLLSAMKSTSFAGRALGEAADVLYEMAADEACIVVGTFSGAMTVAKQGLLLCDMIDNDMLSAVVSTGALMAHGFVEAAGLAHFKVKPGMNDEMMFQAGFDRVYDTLELESNLDDVEKIFRQVMNRWPEEQEACSYTICHALGKWLSENTEGRGILRSAYEQDIPVFIPAFSDSELGLDFDIFNRHREKAGKKRVRFDPFLDLRHYADTLWPSDRLGIFTIGGGVPRNWAQQVGPYYDILEHRGVGNFGVKRFRYAVRICPEPVHWGGLSGCTYSEGISWGKFLPPAEGGRFAEVHADATAVWPLLLAGVLERLGKR